MILEVRPARGPSTQCEEIVHPHDRPRASLQESKSYSLDEKQTPPPSSPTDQRDFGSQGPSGGRDSDPSLRDNGNDKTIISFSEEDPESPYNWPLRKKAAVLCLGTLAVLNSTVGSSLPGGAIGFIGPYFHVANEEQLVLPISLYLVGYVLGPIFFGPLSETYGRRIIMVSSFVGFTIFTLACAVAPNWPAFLLFRLLCGVNASSAIAVVGGLFADVFGDPVTRGRAMAIFMTSTVGGPDVAPIISGYVSPVSWRWSFWIGFIMAGASLAFLIFLPETFAPILLKRRAQRLRQEARNTDPQNIDPQIFAPIELEKRGVKQMVTVILMRPLHMIVREAIVLFSCLYLSLAYAIFYLFFEAYPIIFQGVYKMNPGAMGLTFLPTIAGAVLSLVIFIYYDIILRRAKEEKRKWAEVEEYRRLPLACIGGPFYVISLFWLGWTSKPEIHWAVPMLAGIPFGFGFVLIFMALINYIGDAYGIYSASAMSATGISRSIFGAVLPLAAKPMYATLGISWASSLLAFLSLAMCIIPFAFIRYGQRIRDNSRFCQELKRRKEQLRTEGEA